MFAGQGQFKLKPLTAIKLEACRMKRWGEKK